MVERRSPKPLVGGSSPSCPAREPIFGRGKLNMEKIKAFIDYVKESKEELEKVIFPTKVEVKQSLISVTVMVTIVALFLSLVDLVMSGILKVVL